MRRSTGSDTGSKHRRTFSLKTRLFLAILGVALICILASALLANIITHRQINKFVVDEGLYPANPNARQPINPQPFNSAPRPANPQQTVPRPAPVPNPVPPLPQRLSPPPEPSYLNWIFVLAGVLGVMLALIFSLYLANRISRPLSELTGASREIAEGNYSERVEVGGGAEVEELGHAFNTLADSLERNEELRRQMVADIAHELRNPLATLRGQLELMQDGKVPQSREALDSLMEDAVLLSRLVEDLRQLSLMEAGKMDLDLVPVDAAQTVRSVAARFEHEVAEGAGTIQVRVPDELPRVRADQHRLDQVLGNLVRNALTHLPPGGTVRLEATTCPGGVLFSVSDNGSGIPPEELPYIFERFYRADRSRARATGGAGLGLSIARSLVEAQGGHIRADSEPGRGTTISFTIPTYTAASYQVGG
ncbi:MAG: HAMP domain-containing protein [Actinobacteria bacterium]|nr:HAMP domain-containing protein [Actinomycetota bacterium]MBU1943205.1 HAMP domain-containing protein [Actinomycetota bacterium]MBU2686236.1 HAMP domain-containing protein [Actinomycetota bacterium]